MKKIGLLAAVATALMTSTAAAHGYVGGVFTSADDGDSEALQLEGAVGHVAGSWGFQLDGSLGQVELGGTDADTRSLSGHAYWNGGGWRLGVGATSASLEASGVEAEELSYGAVGTWDFGPNTVLSGSWTTGEFEFLGADVDAGNLDAGIDHYFSPNFRVGGGIGTGSLEIGAVDADTTTFTLDTEFQPWSAPVSITVGYTTFEIDDTFLGGLDIDAFSIGARWNFGGGTLRERDNVTPFDTRGSVYTRAFDLR